MIKNCETVLSVIHNGLAWKSQLLNININKMFKESLRNKYLCHWIAKAILKQQRVLHRMDWWTIEFWFGFNQWYDI